MIIVAGKILVEPEHREASCRAALRSSSKPVTRPAAWTSRLPPTSSPRVVSTFRALGIGSGGSVLSRRRSQRRAGGRNGLSLSV